jgi:mRNA interferase MazF
MKRGEIWIVAGGTYASKPRPAIIIQDDTITLESSVTVVPLTTTSSEVGRLRVLIDLALPDGSMKPSFAQVDKVTTLRKQNVSRRIGAVTVPELRALERSLLAHLGIGSARS